MTSSLDIYTVNADLTLAQFKSHPGIPAGYTHVVNGSFGVDYFCYNATTGQGDIWTLTPTSEFTLKSSTTLRKGCTLVTAANMAGDANRDILLYEPTGGTYDLYQVDNAGALTLLKTTTGVRKTWTSLSMGDFGSRGYHNLFFYDATNGHGEFYASLGDGVLEKVGEKTDLPKGCSQVVRGQFGPGERHDFLFYSPITGEGTFYTVDEFVLTTLFKHTGWTKAWTAIAPIDIPGNQWTSVVFYSAATGDTYIANTDHGNFTTKASYPGLLPKGWTSVTYVNIAGKEALLGYGAPDPTRRPALSRLDLYAVDIKGGIVPIDSRSGIHPGYLTITNGDYSAGGPSILAYDPALGQGDVWTRTDQGGLLWSTSNTTLTKGATLQVNAKLMSSSRSDQLLYFPADGTIEIYRADTPGKLQLAHRQGGMRTTWTHLVMGNFNGSSPYHALFFYDAAAGHGEFWVSDGKGKLTMASEHSNLAKGCTFMAAANLVGNNPANDIVLYNSATGIATMYEVQNCKILKSVDAPVQTGFAHILVANISPTQWSDLLCYDPTRGEITIYTTKGNGELTPFTSKAGFPTDWTAMTRGIFKAGPATHGRTHFAAYNKTMDTSLLTTTPAPLPEVTAVVTPRDTEPKTGRMAIYTMGGQGELQLQTTHKDLRVWTDIVAGSYGTTVNPVPGDLFCYNSSTGAAETIQVAGDGKLSTIATFTDLPKGCKAVGFQTTTKVTGPMSGILLYGAKSGLHIYDAANGKMTLFKAYPAWNKEWDVIEYARFTSTSDWVNILFYKSSTGRAEFWSFRPDGTDLKLERAHDWGTPGWDFAFGASMVNGSGATVFGHSVKGGFYDTFHAIAYLMYRTLPRWSDATPWTHAIRVARGGRRGGYDDVLYYSASQDRTELREITGKVQGVSKGTKSGIGKWATMKAMPPRGATSRVIFYSPTA
ncbi:MAG: hypothetical protein QM705_15455 [Ancrocorticia sp.]